ncbi:GtrA family protein [Ectothiorhodospira mobilis]|uniref:GtrA family protein n=1 Tax=Ectothiorhodospira mobilis TaxID=195064 RepID=UPI000B8845D8|nr:GtrA family protein [Ectothiorhodospira mobilis]
MSILIKQASRFAQVGLLATLLHILLATTLIKYAALTPALANGLAFIGANLVSYICNTIWSFGQAPAVHSWLRFILVSVTGLLTTMVISGAAEAVGWHYGIGIALVVLTVPALSFMLHRHWTYRTA